jgi:hypothetical protein
VNGDSITAARHSSGGRSIETATTSGEVEDLVEHFLLFLLDLAVLRGTAQQHAQLCFRKRLALGSGRLEPEGAEDHLGGSLQHPDQRLPEHEEAPDGRRDGQRRALGVAQRRALGHELADHDVQERDDQKREDHGEDRRHQGIEGVTERLLAQGTDAQAGERHPELHRCDEPRRVGDDSLDRAGTAVALLGELLNPRPSRGDERILGRDEKSVDQNQRRDAEEFQEKGHVPAGPAGRLRGSSSKVFAGV